MTKQYNTTIGLRGDIYDDWSYDVYYQDSTIDYSNEYRNDLSVIAINRGVDVISVNGVPTCVSAINGTDSSCIPYNLFQGDYLAIKEFKELLMGDKLFKTMSLTLHIFMVMENKKSFLVT